MTRSGGSLFVWRYADPTRGYRGWQLAASPTACAVLIAELDRIDQLAPGAHATLPVEPASAAVLSVPNAPPSCGAAVPVRAIELRRVALPSAWQLAEREAVLEVSCGSAKIAELREHLVALSRGEGDVRMGPDAKRAPEDQQLWFWWTPR